MHMRQLLSVLFVAVVLVMLTGTSIYKHVDEDGNVRYSDQPGAGAEELDLRPPSASEPERRPAMPARPHADRDAVVEDSAAYERLRIARPEHEGTVRDNLGNVTVVAHVQPRLRENHYLQLYLDGSATDGPQKSTTFQLTDVHRGEHQLQVRVVDRLGNKVMESPRSIFYMHQASRLFPHRDPGPPPRPPLPDGGAPGN